MKLCDYPFVELCAQLIFTKYEHGRINNEAEIPPEWRLRFANAEIGLAAARLGAGSTAVLAICLHSQDAAQQLLRKHCAFVDHRAINDVLSSILNGQLNELVRR
jgi:hypothetical protein